jgi:hypothetical protein
MSLSHVGPPSQELFRRRRRLSRRSEVHKSHVLRSLTLSKVGPGAYSAYRSNMACLLYFIACDVLCITYRVLLIDGGRLHGSTPSVYHLIVDVLLFTTTSARRS